MSEMIERVALAIYEHAASRPPGQPPWADTDADVRDWIRGHARAAIQAMRDPTPKVSTAILIAASKVASIYDGEIYTRGDAGVFIMAAMIDAALSDRGSER